MARKDYIVGSGNVFKDLGPLTSGGSACKGRTCTQDCGAHRKARLAGFSLDRLVRFLVVLGSDVEIVVKPRARSAGQARLLVA